MIQTLVVKSKKFSLISYTHVHIITSSEKMMQCYKS